MTRRLAILSVNGSDHCGGAEKLAWDLFDSYRRLGHRSWLMVGAKTADDSDVLEFPRPRPGAWHRTWRGIGHRLMALADRWPRTGIGRCLPLVRTLAAPGKWYDRLKGYDDFRYPGTYQMLDRLPRTPDVVHCHNLHGYYFDLRALSHFSHRVPVVLSLHDGWLLSGLCGHSFDCERWKTGCGQCPYLSVWQDLNWSRRDGTAHNWRRKQRIFAKSRLYVTAPCRWMRDRAEQSILATGAKEMRVIPYGVDQTVFQPGDRVTARTGLGIPLDAHVILFVARGLASNPSKDYATLRSAIERLGATRHHEKIIFIARGESQLPERVGSVEISYVPWAADHHDIVRYYQAADVYVHAARMDTFPLSVLEAQACGIPVVATAVGGVPEQIKSLADAHGFDAEEPTGILVPPIDADAMTQALARLLDDKALRERLSENAAAHARKHFDLRRQVADTLEWYMEISQRNGRTINGVGNTAADEIVPVHSEAAGIS